MNPLLNRIVKENARAIRETIRGRQGCAVIRIPDLRAESVRYDGGVAIAYATAPNLVFLGLDADVIEQMKNHDPAKEFYIAFVDSKSNTALMKIDIIPKTARNFFSMLKQWFA